MLHGVRGDAVVPPVPRPVPRRDGQDLDDVDAEVDEVVQVPDGRGEGPLGGERPHVQFVEHGPVHVPAGPVRVGPGERRGSTTALAAWTPSGCHPVRGSGRSSPPSRRNAYRAPWAASASADHQPSRGEPVGCNATAVPSRTSSTSRARGAHTPNCMATACPKCGRPATGGFVSRRAPAAPPAGRTGGRRCGPNHPRRRRRRQDVAPAALGQRQRVLAPAPVALQRHRQPGRDGDDVGCVRRAPRERQGVPAGRRHGE